MILLDFPDKGADDFESRFPRCSRDDDRFIQPTYNPFPETASLRNGWILALYADADDNGIGEDSSPVKRDVLMIGGFEDMSCFFDDAIAEFKEDIQRFCLAR
jgi:hypothetical protein